MGYETAAAGNFRRDNASNAFAVHGRVQTAANDHRHRLGIQSRQDSMNPSHQGRKNLFYRHRPGLYRIGGAVPFFVASLTMTSVGKAAFLMVEEIRRQFREIPGLMEGTGKPDSARCIDISTQAALREMIAPGVVAILMPIIIGFLLGKDALGGMLMGATLSGVLLALLMSNGGGAWDNAKKYVESGHLGGKGSDAHRATVVGDTVGDPLKDTSGPAMNILIKLMSIVSLVLAPLFA